MAMKLGIPTSESHALVAGITGAAIAIQGVDGINFNEWKKVLYGLIVSTIVAFILGYIFEKIIERICKNMDRRRTVPFFKKTQILGGALMSFMNGAQDGQKFIGVFLMGVALSNGISGGENFVIPIWIMIVCSLMMTFGTIIGGNKIIKTVGMKIIKLEPYQGTAADLAGFTGLLFASFTGIPVSTNHTKATSIMGVGASRGLKRVNWGTAKKLVLAWIITFPGCGLLGYLLTLLLSNIIK